MKCVFRLKVITDELDNNEVDQETAGEGRIDQVSMAKARQIENEEIFKEFESKYYRLKQQLYSKSVGNTVAVAEPRPGDASQPSRMK